ncbi:protein pxr1-like [Limosa lapponica baueri]|uniref:Protein pxr1-like n=1 Tax=Limosa lapponica baueri TaxID=1758121 RepID=A0A2I0UHJ6_LIMLA|nr:protein pxr1-like [Limosa lapponica baueri]
MPASSKTDLSLSKAEPISNGGRSSVIIYLRRGKPAAQQQLEREVRICESNSVDTNDSEEGGQGGTPGARAEIPLQPVVKTMDQFGTKCAFRQFGVLIYTHSHALVSVLTAVVIQAMSARAIDNKFADSKGPADEQAAESRVIELSGLKDVLMYCLTYI